MKTCARCHVEKPLDDFSPSKQTKDGKFSYCKPCCTELGAIRYHANKEKYQEKHHAYYVEHADEIKEKQRINGKIYYEENKDKVLLYSSNYKKEHREETQAYQREWRRNNPDRANAIRNRHRDARRGAAIVDLTYEQWVEIQAAWGHRCAYCHKKTKLTMDHLTPVSEGGNHTASNIVPACRSCNSKKNTGPVPVPIQPLLLTATASKPSPAPDSVPATAPGAFADLFRAATVTVSGPAPVPGAAPHAPN